VAGNEGRGGFPTGILARIEELRVRGVLVLRSVLSMFRGGNGGDLGVTGLRTGCDADLVCTGWMWSVVLRGDEGARVSDVALPVDT